MTLKTLIRNTYALDRLSFYCLLSPSVNSSLAVLSFVDSPVLYKTTIRCSMESEYWAHDKTLCHVSSNLHCRAFSIWLACFSFTQVSVPLRIACFHSDLFVAIIFQCSSSMPHFYSFLSFHAVSVMTP